MDKEDFNRQVDEIASRVLSKALPEKEDFYE